MNPHPVDLEELMELHAPALIRYAERMVRDPHAAQDVVQQVFIRYAGLVGKKKPRPHAVRAWLYRATHHRAVDWIRAESRRRTLHDSQPPPDPAASPHSGLDRLQVVRDHLGILTDKERAVLILRLENGLRYREIAETTGLKEGHVGYLLHQAVRKLAAALNPKPGDSA